MDGEGDQEALGDNGDVVVGGAAAAGEDVPGAGAAPDAGQQLLAQLVNILAQAQANAPAAAAAPTSSKHAARAPDKYMGDGSDKLSPDEFINALQLYFMAAKTPEADRAVSAATHLSAHMQTLMFNGMSLDVISDPQQYTWAQFAARFKDIASMGQLQTDLQVYEQILSVRCDLYSKCNTPALLHRIECLWPKMLVQPADGTKIHQVWRALHPELRKQLAINHSSQQQWADYSSFRQHLVSVAPHFDSAVRPVPHPYQRPPPPPKK